MWIKGGHGSFRPGISPGGSSEMGKGLGGKDIIEEIKDIKEIKDIIKEIAKIRTMDQMHLAREMNM